MLRLSTLFLALAFTSTAEAGSYTSTIGHASDNGYVDTTEECDWVPVNSVVIAEVGYDYSSPITAMEDAKDKVRRRADAILVNYPDQWTRAIFFPQTNFVDMDDIEADQVAEDYGKDWLVDSPCDSKSSFVGRWHTHWYCHAQGVVIYEQFRCSDDWAGWD